MANNRFLMQLLQPGKIGRLLLAVLSTLSTAIGIYEFYRQRSAALVVTVDTQRVLLPSGISPTLNSEGKKKMGSYSEFQPVAVILNPRTALTVINLVNKRSEVATNIHMQLADVTRLLYVSGERESPNRDVISGALRVRLSSNTLDISGIPDLPPGNEMEIYVWADHFDFGLDPLSVTTDQGPAEISEVDRVKGVAKTFAYLMVWIVTTYVIWMFWFLLDRFIFRRKWRLAL